MRRLAAKAELAAFSGILPPHYGPNTRPPIGEVIHIDRFGNQPLR